MSSVTAVPLRPTKRRVLIYLWIGILVLVTGAIALAQMAPGDPVSGLLAKNRRQPGVVQTPSGLQYTIIEAGNGTARPTDSDVTLVNYEGKLPDGTTFDKSQQPTPMAVTGVVPGFAEALKLMPKGAKYKFWIPPVLGYGAPRPEGAPPLSGPSAELATKVLIFDVEMVDFLPETVIRQMQQQQQMMQQQGGGAGGIAPGAGAPPPAQ